MIINKIQEFIKANRYQILLVLTVLAGYWQIAFFQTTFKFDAIYNHLPWRFLIVDNLRHGHLPLWNYYHHFGTPIHADPQSGAWYPFVWLLSLFGVYDLYFYNFEFILHIIIAALGMQYLLKTLKYNDLTAYIFSVAYVFSGFLASNSMFLTWVISAAWIPFIIGKTFVLLRRPDVKNSIGLALLIFMLVSGGYPAFTIVLAYILSFIVIYVSIKEFRKDKTLVFRRIKFIILSVFLSAILSSVVLVSVAQVVSQMPRGEPLSLAEAAIPPFLPKHLLSLILPYPNVQLEYDQTVLFDGTNIYMGLLVTLLLLSAVFSFKYLSKELKITLIASVFFLLLAFGKSYFFYPIAFRFLPGFDYFRFPTMFRYFSVLGFLAVAAYIWEKASPQFSLKTLKLSLAAVFVTVLVFFVLSLIKTNVFHSYKSMPFYDFVISFDFWDKAFFQSAFQIFILSLLVVILLFFRQKTKGVIFLFLIDLIVSFNVYMPYTITSYKSNVAQSDKILYQNINEFSLENNKNILENSTHPDSLYLFSHFLFIYQKKVGDKGNTFKLSNFQKLKKKNPNKYYEIINHPLFYFKNEEQYPVKLSGFDYNSLTISTQNPKPDTLVFLQNWYPGWKAVVNGQTEKPSLYAGSFMKVFVPAGKNTITFIFRPEAVIIAFWLSALSFVSAFILILINYFKSKC